MQVATAFYETSNGAFFIDAVGRVTQDSNIFANSSEESDLVYSFSPSIRYSQAKGLISLQAVAGVNATYYSDNNDEDAEDFFANFTLNGPNRVGAKTKYKYSGGFNQSTTADEAVGQVIETTTISTSGSVDYDYSEKYGVRFSGAISDVSYNPTNLIDSRNYRFGVSSLYYYSSKLTFTGGYNYSTIERDNGIDSLNSHAAVLGAEGELASKLKGTIGVGISFIDSPASDNLSPVYNIGLDWSVRDKTKINFTGSRAISSAASGSDSISTTLRTTLTQDFTEQFSGSIFFTIGKLELDGVSSRVDDYYRIGSSGKYTISDFGAINLSLSYEDRESERVLSQYERIIATLGFSFTY
jgi:hypothetical protein